MPFTTEQFFSIFEKYNQDLFQFQIILSVLCMVMVLNLLAKNSLLKNGVVSSLLGLFWIWTGIVYHIVYFSEINKAAYSFGILFIVEGTLLIYAGLAGKLQFRTRKRLAAYLGFGFIIFGLLVYPVLSYYQHLEMSKVITLGLPCPTVIVTSGFLMLTSVRYPVYLLIIPTLWSLIGISTAFNLGVYADLMMIIGVITALILRYRLNPQPA